MNPGLPATRRESWLSIWRRRAVSMPLYLSLATLGLSLAPLWLTLLVCVDLFSGQPKKLPRTRALAYLLLYLACEVVGMLLSLLIFGRFWGGRIGGPRRYLQANAALQRWWTSALFFGGVRIFSMRIAAEGIGCATTGPYLLFVRHSSTADSVLSAALVGNPHRLLLRYIAKRELMWDPCLDVIGRRLPNVFVDRGTGAQGEIDAIMAIAQNLDDTSVVLLYPEGTRFSQKKLVRSREVLRERGHPELADIADTYRRVLPPRLKGAMALLDAAPNTDVVFLEHTGFEGAASFASFFAGALIGRTLHVRARRVPAAEIPATDRERWLFERWGEVDRWLDDKMRREEAARDA